MAYAFEINAEVRRGPKRQEFVVTIRETDAGPNDEWTIDDDDVGFTLPPILTLVSYRAEFDSGNGSEVGPFELGRTASFAEGTLDFLLQGNQVGAFLSERLNETIALDSNRQLVGRSQVDTGSNNRVETEIVFYEGAPDTAPSPMQGVDASGNPQDAQVSPDGAQAVEVIAPLAAFGDMAVAEVTPLVQLQWALEKIIESLSLYAGQGSGSVDVNVEHELYCEAAAGAAGYAIHQSRRTAKYEPGEGLLARFTGRFDGGVVGTEQVVGIIDAEEGYGFGYDGADFGVLHRRGGQVEIRTLTVTGAPGAPGNLTITLNGGAGVTVAVVGADTIASTVRKIAAEDYSDEGGGWFAFDAGDRVIFLAIKAETRAGAYTFADGGTGATAAIAQTVAAVAPADTWIAQANWNGDPCDGTRVMPQIDPTYGYPYAVVFEFLGYGAINFFIEQPELDRFVRVHRIEYAGGNQQPSLHNATLPLGLIADNGGGAGAVTVRTASMGAFVQGPVAPEAQGVAEGFDNTKAVGAAAETVLFAIRVKLEIGTHTNKLRIRLTELSVGNESNNRVCVFRLYRNPGFDGAGTPNWADVGEAVVEADVAAVSVDTGADALKTWTVGPLSGDTFDLDELVLPGDVIAVTADVPLAANEAASLNWLTDF